PALPRTVCHTSGTPFDILHPSITISVSPVADTLYRNGTSLCEHHFPPSQQGRRGA
ncbi:Hypothetical predicted protein, partial [Pelobates cultripes]